MTAKRIYPEDAFVGERIRAMRVAKGVSQTALAESAGITFQQVQKYEKGVNRVSIGRLMRFAELLNISVADFLPPSPAGRGKREAAADPCHQLSLTSRGMRLASAFNGIESEELRQHIMALTESINETQQKKPRQRAAGA